MRTLCMLVATALAVSVSPGQYFPGRFVPPMPGERSVTYLLDTTGVVPGESGEVCIWDFENVPVLPKTFVAEYILPERASFREYFPGATIVREITRGLEKEYSFIAVSREESSVLGMVSGGVPVIHLDPESLTPHMLSYGESASDYYRSAAGFRGDARLERHGSVNATADAYGLLLLPGGVAKHALRINVVREELDSVFVGGTLHGVRRYTARVWEWYTPGRYLPVFSISEEETEFDGRSYRSKLVTLTPVRSGIPMISQTVLPVQVAQARKGE